MRGGSFNIVNGKKTISRMKKSITGQLSHELAVELLKRNQNYKFRSSNTNHLGASMREIAHQTYLANIIYVVRAGQHYHNYVSSRLCEIMLKFSPKILFLYS